MPWLETAPMEQRERFVRDHRLAPYTMAELSARYGISRKTGYKWLDRFEQGGRDGLGDRSRAPRRCPHKISDEVATLICEARRQHPSWGPDKLLVWLGPRHPAVDLPAVSTAGDLLARKGLVKKRRRRRQYQHPGVVPITTAHPMISGPRTSKATFAPATACTVTRSRWPTSTRAICSRVTACSRPRDSACARSSTVCSASTACPTRFAPTMACRLRRPGFTASRSSMFGGCGSAFSTSAAAPRRRRTTARMNGCTRRSRLKRFGRPERRSRPSSARSIASGLSTTRSGRTNSSTAPRPRRAIDHRVALIRERCRPSSIPATSS
jgi:transposase